MTDKTPPLSSPSFNIHKGWLTLLHQAANQLELTLPEALKDTTVSKEQYHRDIRYVRQILQQLGQSAQEPHLSITASAFVDPLTFGCYSLALWTAPDVGALLKNASEYGLVLGSQIRFRHHITPMQKAELWLLDNENDNQELHLNSSGMTLCIATLIQMIHQTAAHPVSVELELPGWPFEVDYREVEQRLQCTIRLQRPICKITIPHSHLNTPLRRSDSVIYHSSINSLREFVLKLSSDDILIKLYHTFDKQASLNKLSGNQVASEMMMSLRTLNRRLADMNTNYRAVLESYKLEKAMHLLHQPHANVTEIAYQLGFSDLSTFSRAFKRWTGHCPKEVKQERFSETT